LISAPLPPAYRRPKRIFPAVCQGERPFGDVGPAKFIGSFCKNARNVRRDIAMANSRCCLMVEIKMAIGWPFKNRIKGSAEQAKGSVKQAARKVFGDKKLETQGSADKAKGKLQNAVGGLKDSVRGK
jgi:uncharacterized protein YjbJ (UPF0337 family)